MLPLASTTRLPTDYEPSDEGLKEAGLARRADGNWREDPWNDGGEENQKGWKARGKGNRRKKQKGSRNRTTVFVRDIKR